MTTQPCSRFTRIMAWTALMPFLFPLKVLASNPSYLLRDLGRASFASSTLRHHHEAPVGVLLNANSLLKRRFPLHRSILATTTVARRSLVRRNVLDFWDPLEPFEMAWEFYCNRYEILDELLGKLASFGKRHSVRALTVVGVVFVSTDLLARLGVFGSGRGKGIISVMRSSERFGGGTQERVLQKTSSFLINRSMDSLRLFKKFGGKSKFAISVSAGAVFGQSIIQLTTFMVRSVLLSFFVLETLSFLGLIGEQGETILDWIDDQRDSSSEMFKAFARFHKRARGKMNFEWLESLYEAAVDEEKIAAFGFSVGTVIGMFT